MLSRSFLSSQALESTQVYDACSVPLDPSTVRPFLTEDHGQRCRSIAVIVEDLQRRVDELRQHPLARSVSLDYTGNSSLDTRVNLDECSPSFRPLISAVADTASSQSSQLRNKEEDPLMQMLSRTIELQMETKTQISQLSLRKPRQKLGIRESDGTPGRMFSMCESLASADKVLEPATDSSKYVVDIDADGPPELGHVQSTVSSSVPDPPGRFSSFSNSAEDGQALCELHPIWQETGRVRRSMAFLSNTVNIDVFKASAHRDNGFGITRTRRASREDVKVHRARQLPAFLDKLVMSPSSERFLIWSLLEGALLTYDLVSIPASLLKPPKTNFDHIMKWVSLFFWTLDLPASCFKGYITKHGDLEMRFGFVAHQYVRHYFFVDWVLIVIEYVNFLMYLHQAGDDLANMGRFMPIFRMLRFSRLLKVGKMRRLLRRLLGQVSSPSTLTIIYTIGQLIGIILLCHTGACCWYVVGDNFSEEFEVEGKPESRRWITFENSVSFGYRYSTCLQWAISQLGYGGIDIYPTNTAERLFSCLFTIVCMVSVSSWVAALVSALIRLQALNESESVQMYKLREYMRIHKVPWNLRNRIWKILRETSPEEEIVPLEQEIDLCWDLPKPVALELRVEVFIPMLTIHPFFGTYGVSSADKHCMQRLLRGDALSHCRLEHEETLFLPGDTGAHMYFLMTGCVDYQWKAASLEVHAKGWVSEASLWLKWFHCGQATARKRCECVSLNAPQFQTIMSSLPEAHRYAKVFYSFSSVDEERLNDMFPELDDLVPMAEDIFRPQTCFKIQHCYPDPSEWVPSFQSWKMLWKSSWNSSNVLSSSAMILTMTTEMKNDAILVFQTLFGQNLPMRDPFHWTSAEEREAYDARVMFLKRYLLLLAVCKVNLTEDDNGMTLQSWPFPLAAVICHGGRSLLQLHDVSWKELLMYLLCGDQKFSPTSTPRGESTLQMPFPFYTRRAATHGVTVSKDTLVLREVRLTGTAALGSHHIGMDLPLGGLGNPLPPTDKFDDLMVGPAGVPYRKGAGGHPSNVQHGHLYVRYDDFGYCMTRRLFPIKSPESDKFEGFNMNDDDMQIFMDTNPSVCFNKISLAHMSWEQLRISDLASLRYYLTRNSLTIDDGDRLNRLRQLIAEKELVLETQRDTQSVRCRGNLLHIIFRLPDGRLLVQTSVKAVEDKCFAEDSRRVRVSDAQSRERSRVSASRSLGVSASGNPKIVDVCVPTVMCRHNELWTTSLSRYCKSTLELGEPAVAHVLKTCSSQAMLSTCPPIFGTCYQHVDACEGIPLEYEVLRIDVQIDAQNKHLFEPLQFEQGFMTTHQEEVDLHGFFTLQSLGTMVRDWQWMTWDDADLYSGSVTGLHAPKAATKLDVFCEPLLINSLLIGIEGSAPLKEDVFGHSHRIDGRRHEVSAFGKRKWRDFRTGGHPIPADKGGVRVLVNQEKLKQLKSVCSEIALCQPSACFSQKDAPKKEMELFQQILQRSDYDFGTDLIQPATKDPKNSSVGWTLTGGLFQ